MLQTLYPNVHWQNYGSLGGGKGRKFPTIGRVHKEMSTQSHNNALSFSSNKNAYFRRIDIILVTVTDKEIWQITIF